METPNDAIIRKIQKLLALGQSPNEQEAATAMALAQSLMAKHNLEAAMVTAAHVKGGTVEAAPEKRENTRVSRSAQYEWQRKLWKTLAEVNFCWHQVVNVFEGKRGTSATTSKKPVKRHQLLGRESNVVICKLMGKYIEDTMERILPFANRERLSRSALSWKAGCADRIIELLREKFEAMQREAVQQTDSNITAIALRDVVTLEYQANYDAYNGAGAWTRKLLSDSKWEAEREQREAEDKARQIKAELDWLNFLQNESPKDKKKRERQEDKERIASNKRARRYSNTYWNQRDKEAAKVDRSAYGMGKRDGDKVRLSTQVPETNRTTAERRLK